MSLIEIQKRYDDLAEATCCLSCGGAVDHAKAKEGEVCVDLGSGRGTDVIRMAQEVGQQGRAVGIDASEGMIRKAKRHADKLGMVNVEFIQSELEQLPLEDNSVDLIISNCTINHAADKQQVWNEIYRILREGGRFVISDIYSTDDVPSEYKNDPVAIAECWAGSVTRYNYMEQLQIAGFTNVHVIEESKPYPKGEIEVCSWTISATKKACCCC